MKEYNNEEAAYTTQLDGTLNIIDSFSSDNNATIEKTQLLTDTNNVKYNKLMLICYQTGYSVYFRL